MSTDSSTDQGSDKGIRILSLDSGGPGTYSQLLIIKEYMIRLSSDLGIDEAELYPADYFDLMGGVGFGGLVAILLGYLRMNVDEAIEALLDVALAIFPVDSRPECDSETRTKLLGDSVKNILQTRGIPPDQKMQDTREDSVGCKVALYATTSANINHPTVLRTYKPRGSCLNPTIIDAICATMATPYYFSPIKIGPRGRQQTFIGGPLGAKNPTRELLKEANTIFGKEKLVSQVVSIGCGRSHISSMEAYTDTNGDIRLLQEIAAECEGVEKDLSTRLCDMGEYLRLNVERGMENLVMTEWDDLGPIESHTSAYIETDMISEALESSLKRLQGRTGAVTLGQINHPGTTKDIVEKLEKQKEDLGRTIKLIRDAEYSHLLEQLKPVIVPSYQEDHGCMEGTRTIVLDNLVAWAVEPAFQNNLPDGSGITNMYWLYGSPGLGKTSVANSLCDRLRENGILGGSFFCKHDNVDLREPKRVLPTLIAKLVRMWGPFRNLVAKILLDEPQINPDSTRGELLLKSLRLLKEHPPHPLVLVIDALDECGQHDTRRPLLNCLLEACSLVCWLRVVVTSRPEHDLKTFFDSHNVTRQDLAADPSCHDDIRLFTQRRFAAVAIRRHLPPDWPQEECITKIVKRSDGLFIFVETLSRLVDVPEPEQLLAQALSGSSQVADTTLHQLYSTAITSRITHPTPAFHSILRAIVAVSTNRPLSEESLAELMSLELRVVRSWVDELSSLLYRDHSKKGEVRVHHLSILEFLVGPGCPAAFRVDMGLANAELACYCLKTMANKLRFNICELKTSYLFNAEIQDLDDQVEQSIPDSLQYSCVHWSDHLCYDAGPVSVENKELLDKFFAGPQPLYWIEVLSLMHKVPAAIAMLRAIKSCAMRFEDQHQCLVEDVLRFVLGFLTPISTSTAHLYVSALAFMPTESKLWKHTRRLFPNGITVCEGRMRSWPNLVGVRQGHRGEVRTVAYSPDGRYIVSGSQDKTIRIWDVDTGAAVGEPLKGHTKYVLSVAYSPDGRHIVSGGGDKTIRIWDAETGAAICEPLMGHTGEVYDAQYSPDGRNIVSSGGNTVRIWDAGTQAQVGPPLKGRFGPVFCSEYSPDGRHIVSGCGDMVMIWDAKTGKPVGMPLKGHYGHVYNTEYSPDGRRIVSCGTDRTIRIWDAKAGTEVLRPLRGHTKAVFHAEYSPDSRCIVSCAADQTIRIWDAETGVPIGEPVKGHTEIVYSVSYSPDCRYIVSGGGGDQTIRTWDANTGEAVGEPLEGHSALVYSVAYSPDDRRIVSCGADQTVRVWDATTGAEVIKSLKGHTGLVNSVAYSPDGRHIVSGSADKTILIWDAETGAAAFGPLTGHSGSVYDVKYLPDGLRIISCSADCTIRLWDAKKGMAVGKPLQGHVGGVYSVACSPDGRHIVSGGDDLMVRIWDAKTGAAVGRFRLRHIQAIWCIAYSPDSRHIVVSGDGERIQIWDVETGVVVVKPFKGHEGGVCSVSYSPDGQHIVSGGHDQMIRIWDARTGVAACKPLKGHTGVVQSVAYSRDGRLLASGSGDLTIRVWDAQTKVAKDEPGGLVEEHTSLTAFSGRRIPPEFLESDGWVIGESGLLFWIPEDCRNGLTCPAIMTIPDTGRQRRVRLDFAHFCYGSMWTDIYTGNTPETEVDVGLDKQ